MPAPTTEKFEQMTLEISEDGTVWTKICGLIGVTITRSTQFDSSEVPADCVDESLPLKVERALRTVEVSVSADGVYAQQSHKTMSDWFYSGATKQVRVGHAATLAGDPQYEQGPAFLTTFNNTRTKGQKVTASIALTFDGTPSRILKV
ncbi:hypothetical protein A6J80_17445 [Paracoccus yeei]|uniref:Phage tail protein n=1 Tax=Paracoccus yeei TaxID=147645 RepID=A0A1V0GVQ4_9RHOB|nr:phage tail tube protein [Paracoccus yeei]ARC37898.1 hypothetical protein A6J80_17445 [Paracoccus yeei]QEU08771.1 hypothetical protein FOB51_12635 [Paracoccus yeei]